MPGRAALRTVESTSTGDFSPRNEGINTRPGHLPRTRSRPRVTTFRHAALTRVGQLFLLVVAFEPSQRRSRESNIFRRPTSEKGRSVSLMFRQELDTLSDDVQYQ